MDYLLELLFGLFVEVPLNAAIESKRVKPWVKTALVAVLCGLVLALIGWAAYLTWLGEGWSLGTIFLCGFFFAGLAFTVWFTVDGHKRDWRFYKPF